LRDKLTVKNLRKAAKTLRHRTPITDDFYLIRIHPKSILAQFIKNNNLNIMTDSLIDIVGK